MAISVSEAYATLGLEQDASPEQVKKAYRKLALQFHPDKNSDPAATATFQKLSAAYKRLDDHANGVQDSDDEDFFEVAVPSMEEMLFMFDMLFGMAGARPRRGGKRNKGRGVHVNMRRRGGRQQSPFGPSYMEEELMDMFAHQMMFGDVEDCMFEEDFMDGEFVSESPPWSFQEDKPATTPKSNRAKPKTPKPVKKKNVFSAPPPVGSKVWIYGRQEGEVKFVGNVHYAKGSFVGVALTAPEGKNDGSVKGVRYFECAPCHGLMVRPEDVTPLAA